MPLLTREEAFKVSKRATRDVHIPELDGDIRCTSLTAKDSFAIKGLQARDAKGENIDREQMVLLLMNGLIDSDGKPFLATSEQTLEFIAKVSIGTVKKLSEAIWELSIPKPKDPSGNSEASTTGA